MTWAPLLGLECRLRDHNARSPGRLARYSILLLLVAGMGILLVPGQADARRSIFSAEARALRIGVETYVTTSGCCASGVRVRLMRAWISTVDKDFAVARIAVSVPRAIPGPNATAVLVPEPSSPTPPSPCKSHGKSPSVASGGDGSLCFEPSIAHLNPLETVGFLRWPGGGPP